MVTKAKKIDGFSLDNILQIFSMEKKSQTLHITKEGNVGMLDIDNGELVHAELGGIDGLNAAIEIILWDDIQIELFNLRSVSRTINSSIINILLEVSRLKDERKNSLDESGEELLGSSISKAEQQQYKEAHADLVQYMKKNRSNSVAWIWYSRIQGNVEIMKKALKMAASLDADNPLVKEEQSKFAAVSDHLTDDVVRKCYFCWAPLNKSASVCQYCGGHLAVTRETLAQSGSVDTGWLTQAHERYTRILGKHPRSLIALYCLALISVNNRNFQDALAYLDKAAKMAPDKALFANQLKLLLDHLARQSVEEQSISEKPATTVAPVSEETADVVITPEQKMILVVEDSSTTRKVISITLSRQGYRVVEAADGLEALSRISEERPDLIMLDVILPKMDGYKILSIIKGNREFKDIPVIMLTSKDGFINKMKGKMAGSSAYLTKPFDPDMMIAEIRKYV
ncbi:MAG: response regulator [Desulfobulbus sp.]|jgi:twitching motility two-component system response regulator PilG|uniref:response regulator n=1 Tax=Desulfobulbus sp. TaxID=895 RepID=UPI00284AE9C2|nr:response regulator [Desulfobulbus sp.]MDR2549886.1 response regulator [Desulfobulbus sp.]